jgi:hypothetical protein
MRLFAMPPRLKRMAWGFKIEYDLTIAIGGSKHGGDTGNWHMSHLNNL